MSFHLQLKRFIILIGRNFPFVISELPTTAATISEGNTVLSSPKSSTETTSSTQEENLTTETTTEAVEKEGKTGTIYGNTKTLHWVLYEELLYIYSLKESEDGQLLTIKKLKNLIKNKNVSVLDLHQLHEKLNLSNLPK